MGLNDDLAEIRSAETTAQTLFETDDLVQKYKGEVRWFGIVRSVYATTRGSVRYVVEVIPQGFQMISTERDLRFAPPRAKSLIPVLQAAHAALCEER